MGSAARLTGVTLLILGDLLVTVMHVMALLGETLTRTGGLGILTGLFVAPAAMLTGATEPSFPPVIQVAVLLLATVT